MASCRFLRSSQLRSVLAATTYVEDEEMKQVREKEKATVVLLATLYAADKHTFEVSDNANQITEDHLPYLKTPEDH